MPKIAASTLSSEQANKLFAREYTNLSPKQADEVRAFCKANGKPLPSQPQEKVRIWYEEIAKKPIPRHILAATKRPAAEPLAHPAAVELAEEYSLDLRMIGGTGPMGAITVKDVRAKLEEVYNRAPREFRRAKGGPVVPPGSDGSEKPVEDDEEGDEPVAATSTEEALRNAAESSDEDEEEFFQD